MRKNMLMKTALASFAAAAMLGLLAGPAQAQDFSRYVAVGDSLTAGVEGNCLVQRNQVASFPAVLAGQLSIANFQQPLVQELPLTDPLVGIPCLGAVFIPPSTVTVGEVSQMGAPLNLTLAQPYNNLGIPVANTADLIDLTMGNPAGDTVEASAALVLRNVPGSPFAGTNAVTQANLLQPDLVSLWIGANDVLGAALSGTAILGVTITPIDQFTAAYQADIAALQAAGRTLVAANIPDVSTIPFTTTIPPVLVDPATREPVIVNGQLVPLLGQGDAAYPCTPVPPDQGCPLPPGTLVTLPASPLLSQGVGVPVAAGGTGLPLPNGQFIPPSTLVPGVVLYPDEVELISSSTTSMNSAIASAVAAAGGILIDIHGLYQDVKTNGYHIGGIDLTSDFLTGGVFSADGYHPSSIGYTIVADEFVRALNASLGLEIPRPDYYHVLFTPNVPSIPAPAVRGGGAWHYAMSTWKGLLASAAPARGMTVRFPDTVAAEGGGRGTRTVTRSPGN
jgi:lysophospholipase L1-like esterase